MSFNKTPLSRTILGLFAACVTTVIIGVVATCLYATTLVYTEDTLAIFNGRVSGSKDVFLFFLYLGSIGAIAATAISLLTAVITAWPIYYLFEKFQNAAVSLYIFSGFIIAIIISTILFIVQHKFAPLPTDTDYYFEAVTICVAGSLSGLSFWKVTR